MSESKYDVQMKLDKNQWCIFVNGEIVFSGIYLTVKRVFNDKKQHKQLINSYVDNFVKK